MIYIFIRYISYEIYKIIRLIFVYIIIFIYSLKLKNKKNILFNFSTLKFSLKFWSINFSLIITFYMKHDKKMFSHFFPWHQSFNSYFKLQLLMDILYK